MRLQIFSLLVTMAVLSIPALATSEAADESKIIERLERLGGKITRNESLPDRPVVGVSVRSGKMTDAELIGLSRLKNLSSLNLDEVKVTTIGFKHLRELDRLTSLNLSGASLKAADYYDGPRKLDQEIR
jgi:internalin A